MRSAAAFAAAGALVVLSACSSDDPELTEPKRNTISTTTTTAAAAGAGTGPATTAGSDSAPRVTRPRAPVSADAYKAEGDYEDGRHIGKLTSFEYSTLGVDVVQFLTGEEAREAYARDTGSTDGPPNDYYVRNQSTTVRLLPVSDDVEIRVNTSGGYEPSNPNEGHEVSARTFASYFSDGTPPEGLFWITIEDGDITAIEEQYLP